ncbi:MAG: DUF4199 domain-containing protein [Muribaculaceae bacterium]|nr:DUF4199 domain-containing protein [Muribaculaceae bacterium]
MSNEVASDNVYRRGASDGVLMGLVLCGIFASWALSMRWALASLAFPLLCVAVPVLAWWLLRRAYRADGCRSPFATLWMHGICIFFFGTLLMAALSLVWLRWLEPGLIHDSMAQAADVYAQLPSPQAQAMAADVRMLIDRGMVPRAIDVALALLWAGVFSGSILSIILAAIIHAVNKR